MSSRSRPIGFFSRIRSPSVDAQPNFCLNFSWAQSGRNRRNTRNDLTLNREFRFYFVARVYRKLCRKEFGLCCYY